MTCYQRICQGQGLAVRSKKRSKIKISNWVIFSCHLKEHDLLSVCAEFHCHRIKNDEDMALWKVVGQMLAGKFKTLNFQLNRYSFFTLTHRDFIFGKSIESVIGYTKHASYWPWPISKVTGVKWVKKNPPELH